MSTCLFGYLTGKAAPESIQKTWQREERTGQMKKLCCETGYFLRQKIFVICLAITAICSYGFGITHIGIGVDDTMVELYLEDGLEVTMGRWTVYLINKLFHFGEFSPFITEFAGLLLLLLAVTLYCVLIRRILGDRIGILGYTAFACTFVSFPFISEVWVYYYHDGVDIGYVLAALSLLAFLNYLEQPGKGGRKYLLFSLLSIWGAVGCYESFLILYLAGCLMLLFFRGLAGKENLTLKRLFQVLFVCFCISVACIILRSLIQKLLIAVFSLQTEGFRDFSYGLQLFKENGLLQNIFMLVKRYWLIYYVNGAIYFPIAVHVLSVAVFGTASVALSVKKKNGWYLLLFLGMIILPFLLTFVEQKPPLYRACQYMPFFVASAVLLLYCFFVVGGAHLRGRAARILFSLMAIWLVWNQAYESNYSFYTDYRKYEHDKDVLTEIAWTVARDYGPAATVIFTGKYAPSSQLTERYYAGYASREFATISRLTDWLDPHLKEKYYRPYGYSFAGEAQYSVIEWGLYAYDHPGLELIHFLQMHGFSLQTVTDNSLISDAEKFAETMPSWPREGSITEWNGYVIVHF